MNFVINKLVLRITKRINNNWFIRYRNGKYILLKIEEFSFLNQKRKQ